MDVFRKMAGQTNDQRLTRIEGVIGSLTSDVASLAASVKSLTDNTNLAIKKLSEEINTVANRQVENTKVNWGWFISGLTALVMILGLVVYQPLQEMRDVTLEHIRDGHPSSLEREMRLLDKHSREKIKELIKECENAES